MITKIIDRNFANMRLDRFLRKAFPLESLSIFFAIIRKKKVRVNGIIGKANQMLNEGDTVCIYENLKSVSNEINSEKESNETKNSWNKIYVPDIDIVLQTEDFIVVNKPSGVPSQPGTDTRPGESLVEQLWQWGKSENLDFKPTIAHRLDKETSGMIIAALHGDTLRDLTRMIRNHEIDKFYFALVKGNLKKEIGSIDESLLRTDAAKGSKIVVSKDDKNAKKAITHYKVYKRYDNFDLVKIKLETGRMHQIRAHFASIGHPLLGDTRYGDFALNREAKKQFGLTRLFLHSCRLEFFWKGEKIVLDCVLPKELKKVLEKIANKSNNG